MKPRLQFLKALGQLPYLPLWLGPLVLLAPVIFTGQGLFWGTPYLQFVPWRAWAAEMLRSGQLPLWNPLVGMGAPLLANYQSALFYPPNWLQLLLGALGGPAWLAWAQAPLVALHLAWSGIGMARLARRVGINPLGQTVGGLAYGLCGYLVARAGFLSINAAAAWLPWILLAGTGLALASPLSSTGRWSGRNSGSGGPPARPAHPRPALPLRQVVALAVCMTMQLLAGHAQTTYYTLLLLAAWVVGLSWQAGGWRRTVWSVGGLALALGLAVGLAAVQLIPTAEYLQQSQRAAAVGYDYAMNYSFFPLRLVTLLSANLLGSPSQGGYLLKADNYWEDAVYVGLLPLLLALAAVVSSYRSKASPSPNSELMLRLAHWLGVLILVAFILALGKNSPIFPWLYRHVPTFNMFQAPARFTLWAEFGLAMLAAVGAHAWRRPGRRGLGWVRRGIAVGVAVVLAAAAAAIFLQIRAIFILATALAGLLGIAAGFLALYAPEGDQAPIWWRAAVVGLVLLDLLMADWGLNPGASLQIYRQSGANLAQVRAASGGQRLYLDPQVEETLKFERFFTLNNFQPAEDWQTLRNIYLPDSAMLDGLPSANNFDPLVPARYSAWTDALAAADSATHQNLLRLMGVGASETLDSTAPAGVRFDPVLGGARLRWVSCIQPAASPEEALRLVIGRAQIGGADLMGRASIELPPGFLAEKPAALLQTECRTGQATAVPDAVMKLIKDEAQKVTFDVQAAQAGWVLLADTWYPGWQARVDGVPAELAAADSLFRALLVPAGAHRVELVYRPFSFYLGIGISLFTLIIIELLIRFIRHTGKMIEF